MADDITVDQNRGHEVLAVTVALFVAATFAVILRFVSRLGVVKRISADDYAMLAAWVSRCRCHHLFLSKAHVLIRTQLIAFGLSFSICYGTSVGLGRHEVNVRPEDHAALKKSEYAFSVLYARIRHISCGHVNS